MQLIKGESANWANKQKIISPKLEWADEYFAVSVSESKLDIVRKYITKQVEHHKAVPYGNEYLEFIKKYGFSLCQG